MTDDPLLIWGLGLLAAAILLIAAEIFIPSGGIISLVAAAVAIAGIVCLFRVSPLWGFAGLLAVLILGPTVAFFSLNVLPSTPMGRKLLHGGDGEDPGLAPLPVNEFEQYIGAEAVAVTDLRPAGTVRVGDKRIDAVCEVALVPSGTRVRVTAAGGNYVKVRPVA